jgi:hypothetical protein
MGSVSLMSLEERGHPDVVEIPAGFDLGQLEVVLARLGGDGIPVRLEPDTTGTIPDDPGGYRLLLRRNDLEAAAPVLRAAGIDPEPQS